MESGLLRLMVAMPKDCTSKQSVQSRRAERVRFIGFIGDTHATHGRVNDFFHFMRCTSKACETHRQRPFAAKTSLIHRQGQTAPCSGDVPKKIVASWPQGQTTGMHTAQRSRLRCCPRSRCPPILHESLLIEVNTQLKAYTSAKTSEAMQAPPKSDNMIWGWKTPCRVEPCSGSSGVEWCSSTPCVAASGR